MQMHLRLRGGGGDGGATGAESRSSYLEMYMQKKPDKVRAESFAAHKHGLMPTKHGSIVKVRNIG